MLRLQKKKTKQQGLQICRSINLSPRALHRGGVWSWSCLGTGRKASSAILYQHFPTSCVSPSIHSTRALAQKRECLSRGTAQRFPWEKLEAASMEACSHPPSGAPTGLYSRLPGCWDCLGRNPHDYSHHFPFSSRQGQPSNRRESQKP